VEAWGFIWIMVILKIPLVALLWLVWYSVTATPDPAEEEREDDGGIGRPNQPDPRGPARPRRRGPHGEPPLPSPPRTRTPARARERVSD